jgi:hypothetical protein
MQERAGPSVRPLTRSPQSRVHQQSTVACPLGSINTEQLHGGGSYWRETLESVSVPPKMLRPHMIPRVEEGDQLGRFGNEGRNVRPFVGIALSACPAEVIESRRPAVLKGANVVDFVRQHRRALRHETVFAAIGSPLSHDLPQALVHHEAVRCKASCAFAFRRSINCPTRR